MNQSKRIDILSANFATSAFLLLTSAFVVAARPAAGATFTIIHDFSNGADGGLPGYTLALKNNHLFGTTFQGGSNGYGTVFNLFQQNNAWRVKSIYNTTSADGQPDWGVNFHKGSIYTVTDTASVGGPCGTALKLDPSGKGGRTATQIHTFVYSVDGCPSGDLISDAAGNLYGVTQIGAGNGVGAVFELTPGASGWTETILYVFTNGQDGGRPYAGLVRDSRGRLYGTAAGCRLGDCNGAVFELSRTKSGWAHKTLYTFNSLTNPASGSMPTGGLIEDSAGNLYGATESAGANGGGTVFELSPTANSWTLKVLADLPAGAGGPVAALTMDAAGNLYGTNYMNGANGVGSVFKLTNVSGSWKYQVLHDFAGAAGGSYPGGGVVLDSNGNLFGTAGSGGAYGWGVAYEITP